MPSFIEQFKQALSSREALIIYQINFQHGFINPRSWTTEELIELHNELLNLYRMETKNFVQEKINFFHYLMKLLQSVMNEEMEAERKNLFQKIIWQFACYIKIAGETHIKPLITNAELPSTAKQEQNVTKRPLESGKLPRSKKRKVQPIAPKTEEHQFLQMLGYEQKLIRIILSNGYSSTKYSLLIRWHEQLIDKLSHHQLISLALVGNEESFLALNTYWSILKKRFAPDDIINMVMGTEAFMRISHLCHHLDTLSQKGFSKNQLISISKSANSLYNIPIINEQLYRLNLDELVHLITQSPSEFFSLLNHYFEYFDYLSFKAKHFKLLINNLPRVYWIIKNINYLALIPDINPDDLCIPNITLIERSLNAIKIQQLHELGYQKLEEHNQLDFLLLYTNSFKVYEFTFADILILSERPEVVHRINEYLGFFSLLHALKYSLAQIVQVGMNPELSIEVLHNIVSATTVLLECNYQHSDILKIVTMSKGSKSLATSINKASALCAQGYKIVDLEVLFSELKNEQIDAVLKNSPLLLAFGFTHKQILKIALNNGVYGVELINRYGQQILDAIKKNVPQSTNEEVVLILYKKIKYNCTVEALENLLKDMIHESKSRSLMNNPSRLESAPPAPNTRNNFLPDLNSTEDKITDSTNQIHHPGILIKQEKTVPNSLGTSRFFKNEKYHNSLTNNHNLLLN